MNRQRGSSLVVALFIVVVVALLAAFAVRVSSAGRQTGSLSQQTSRALAAARSGVEWSEHQARTAGPCQDTPPTTLLLSEGALSGFRVTVSCHAYPHGVYSHYEITSIAEYGVYGSVDYASRTVTVRYFSPGY